ncbi:MAG: glycoside hydrolase family 88 protein [Clostridia bacterium]|nr:glycoside hydrolase family 88 protein [Clostridia bacterium]
MDERIDRFIQSLVEQSTPERTAWNVERLTRPGKTGWNYIDGCMLTALQTLSEITGEKSFADFVESVLDAYVRDDGSIDSFDAEKHRLDDINEGRVLFPVYQKSGKEKYRLAAETLHRALKAQPRTGEGSYWHKEVYPNQVWLDGIYMAMPFQALYERHFGQGDYSDIVRQIRTVRDRMRDPQTGLYYHGYDYSRKAYWADPVTGLSRSFWLRAIGWFSVALTDLCEIVTDADAAAEIAEILRDLMRSLRAYCDEETGLYWQVVDQPGREGNYLESSGSAMIAYSMLKGARLGVLDDEYRGLGRKTFDGLAQRHLTFEDGRMGLDHICLVAGLGTMGGKERDGSYEYYISEPVVSNDAKGVAPFVLCYSEIRRLGSEA